MQLPELMGSGSDSPPIHALPGSALPPPIMAPQTQLGRPVQGAWSEG